MLTRATTTMSASGRRRYLIDHLGRYPLIPSDDGIRVERGVFHAPYAVTERGVFSPAQRSTRPDAKLILLSTPTQNLEYARHTEGPYDPPLYLVFPLGVLLGSGRHRDDRGGRRRLPGFRALARRSSGRKWRAVPGFGSYVAINPPTVTPLAPGVPSGAD